jgi:hypothetical protein
VRLDGLDPETPIMATRKKAACEGGLQVGTRVHGVGGRCALRRIMYGRVGLAAVMPITILAFDVKKRPLPRARGSGRYLANYGTPIRAFSAKNPTKNSSVSRKGLEFKSPSVIL